MLSYFIRFYGIFILRVVAAPNLNKGIEAMTALRNAEYAATLLRVSLGVMYVAHSLVLKYFVFTLPGTAQFFQSLGLPAALAYATFWAELLGGLLLIAGIGSRWVALALVPVLVGATWVHAGNGWVFSAQNGGWEYPVFLIVASIVQALLGDGRYAVANMLRERRLQGAYA